MSPERILKAPLVIWWLVAAGLVMLLSLSGAYAADNDSQERIGAAQARDWQETTLLVTGELTGFDNIQDILPFSWQADASYRVSLPDDAAVGAGETTTVVDTFFATSRHAPTAADAARTQQLRISDDAEHEVVQAGAKLRSAGAEVAFTQKTLDQKHDRDRHARLVSFVVTAVLFVLLAASTLLRPRRGRRFAGSRLPAEVRPPDGPFSQERWDRRSRYLPQLEKDALSAELPVGLIVLAGMTGILALGSRNTERAILIVGAVVLASLALWIRERHASALRDAWSRLGRESHMGMAPDTEPRLKARSGHVAFRLAGLIGMTIGAGMLLFGVVGLALFGELNVPNRAVGTLAGGAVLMVTAGVSVAAGIAQWADQRRERALPL